MDHNQASGVTPNPVDQNGDNNEMVQLGTDWQISKKSIKERTSVMFNNELMADVHFTVGSDSTHCRIPAHKFILATGSPVFYAMFYGMLAGGTEEVTISDVEPEAFLTVLRYLYCDDVSLEADTVLPTLYAAKKYMLPHLAKACVECLETNIDASNACLLLSQTRIYEESDLEQHCLSVIDLQTEEAIESDSFAEIDIQTLEQILTRDTLCAKETLMFAAATWWAEAECTRQGRDINPEQCREVLGLALYLLRLPTMTPNEFANGVVQSGLLSKQEIIDVFLFFNANDKPKVPFLTVCRKGPEIKTCNRFQVTGGKMWEFTVGRINSIKFSVDKAISVIGFGLYGSGKLAACPVHIALQHNDGTVLCKERHSMSDDGSSNTTQVMFSRPVRIKANTYYTASFVEGFFGLGHYGISGMAHVRCDNINFTFMNDPDGNQITKISQGQIPEILFYH